ncbi:hypothetical protein [Siminovitchia fordii]|uniref:Uncharacterized protein n=1 Tax=Siminovitchia fordii TaxID=254759 RepID=A0ABQ4K777_9BACI|nr:hypothetical protein [Siminovitchia fordii]GIN20885.1 hypothetical protein J1TS3_20190 [Siminovitchia fordii]
MFIFEDTLLMKKEKDGEGDSFIIVVKNAKESSDMSPSVSVENADIDMKIAIGR